MNLDHETLRSFLERRERELTHQVAALCGQIESKRAELAEIQRVRATLAPSPPSPPDVSSFERAADDIRAAPNRPRVDLMQQTDNPPVAVPSSNEKLTIKSMILTALSSHYHDGATPAELRIFIKNVFRREIDRTSMSPQLARLREDGAVEQTDRKWRLSERARQRGGANNLQPQKLEDT